MEKEKEVRLIWGGMAGLLMVLIFLLANSFSSLYAHIFDTEEISNWEAVVTDDYTVDWRASRSEIIAVFSYEYGGNQYNARSFSPFGELNEAAGEDRELVQRLLSRDHYPITVYLNPENPEMASMASGWSRAGYFNDLSGVVLIVFSLVGIYFCLRPVRRLQDLISE